MSNAVGEIDIKKERCPGCHQYNYHAVECPEMSIEERLDEYRRRYKALTESLNWYQKSIQTHSQLAAMWHGKYAIVKHENNKLRRKLYRQNLAEDGEARILHKDN